MLFAIHITAITDPIKCVINRIEPRTKWAYDGRTGKRFESHDPLELRIKADEWTRENGGHVQYEMVQVDEAE